MRRAQTFQAIAPAAVDLDLLLIVGVAEAYPVLDVVNPNARSDPPRGQAPRDGNAETGSRTADLSNAGKMHQSVGVSLLRTSSMAALIAGSLASTCRSTPMSQAVRVRGVTNFSQRRCPQPRKALTIGGRICIGITIDLFESFSWCLGASVSSVGEAVSCDLLTRASSAAFS